MNLRDAIRKKISFTDPKSGKSYALKSKVRPSSKSTSTLRRSQTKMHKDYLKAFSNENANSFAPLEGRLTSSCAKRQSWMKIRQRQRHTKARLNLFER